jgi:hypothetical protein
MRETQDSGANVAFSVPRKRLQGVTTLESRIKQGQLWVVTPVALRNSHRFGAPLNEDGTGRGFQVQAPLHIQVEGPLRTDVPIHEGSESAEIFGR